MGNINSAYAHPLKDRGRRPKGGEWEPNQILLQELAYIQSSNPKAKTLQEYDEHTNQQNRNDPLEVTNTTEKNGINWTPG
jgi:hypothetical protein